MMPDPELPTALDQAQARAAYRAFDESYYDAQRRAFRQHFVREGMEPMVANLAAGREMTTLAMRFVARFGVEARLS